MENVLNCLACFLKSMQMIFVIDNIFSAFNFFEAVRDMLSSDSDRNDAAFFGNVSCSFFYFSC